MPYGCRVVAREGARVELDVVPEQPDCEPLYTSARFALGLLMIDGIALEALAAGAIDAAPYIRTVRATVTAKGSWGQQRAPVVRYAIEATDAKWVAHLAVGAAYDSYAWSEAADEPRLGEAETHVPRVARVAERLENGARVALHEELGLSPGAANGRGTLKALLEPAKLPRNAVLMFMVPRKGPHGDEVEVELDHGVRVEAPAIALRRAPADTYERVYADPTAWFAALTMQAPLERARSLRWLALQSGGDLVVPGFGPEPLHVASRSVALWALARRMDREVAITVMAKLVREWLADPASLTARIAAPFAPTELAVNDVAVVGAYEIACPLELALGALTLLLAFPTPCVLPWPIAGLDALATTTWLGYPPPIWAPRTAYLRAALRDVPAALPATLVSGAARVSPSDTDLYAE